MVLGFKLRLLGMNHNSELMLEMALSAVLPVRNDVSSPWASNLKILRRHGKTVATCLT